MAKDKDVRAPEAETLIRDFAGYTPNADPHDLPPGVAITQVNTTSVRPGELRVRPGCRTVRYD